MLTGIILLLLVVLCGGEPKPKQKKPDSPRPRRELPRDPSFDNYFYPREQRVRYAGPPRYTQ